MALPFLLHCQISPLFLHNQTGQNGLALYTSLWTLENDLIFVIHGKDHDLVIGEMPLKRGEFG